MYQTSMSWFPTTNSLKTSSWVINVLWCHIWGIWVEKMLWYLWLQVWMEQHVTVRINCEIISIRTNLKWNKRRTVRTPRKRRPPSNPNLCLDRMGLVPPRCGSLSLTSGVLSNIPGEHRPELSITPEHLALIKCVGSSGNIPLSLTENHNHLQIKCKYKQM